MGKGLPANQVFTTGFDPHTGLRKLIREKQQALDKVGTDEGRNGLMLLIKASDQASYTNLMNTLDEALIQEVKKYAVVRPNDAEVAWLAYKKP